MVATFAKMILESFEEINWVTWRAINTNKISKEAHIWDADIYRLKTGIIRDGVQVYFEQF